MSSSHVEKSGSDVEMGEAGQAPLVPASQAPAVQAVQEAIPSLPDGFDSFKAKLSRRSAAKGSKRARTETPDVSSAAPTPLPAPLVPSSTTTSIPVVEADPAPESMHPPPAKGEIVLALRAPSATPTVTSKGCKRPYGNPGGPIEGYRLPSGLASGSPGQFVSLIDGMLGQCGSEVIRLSKELESSQEALKRTKAALQTVEDTHAAQTSQLEVRISDLECDLGKTASSLLKVKKEKKSKSSEVRRLQQKVQTHEEMNARRSSEVADARDNFFGRLTRMATLFESLIAIRKRDLALAGIEGGISEAQLFLGETPPFPRAEEARLSIRKAALAEEKGDFDFTLAGLKSECTLLPYSVISEDQDPIAEDDGSAAPNPERMIGEDEGPGVEEV
ncbi:hypothetical protein Bca101_082775 [Brassica carinata]